MPLNIQPSMAGAGVAPRQSDPAQAKAASEQWQEIAANAVELAVLFDHDPDLAAVHLRIANAARRLSRHPDNITDADRKAHRRNHYRSISRR